jgi:hypothetical protein
MKVKELMERLAACNPEATVDVYIQDTLRITLKDDTCVHSQDIIEAKALNDNYVEIYI